jgi:hypothetical protein
MRKRKLSPYDRSKIFCKIIMNDDCEQFKRLIGKSDDDKCKSVTREMVDLYSHHYRHTSITPFHFAARYCRRNILECILQIPNLNINMKDKSGHSALLRCLDTNKKCVAEDVDICVKLLLKHPNINVNQMCDCCRTTPLMQTMEQCIERYRLFNLLLKHPHIDVSVSNNDGITALIYAAAVAHANCMRQLLQFDNVNVNTMCSRNQTAVNILPHSAYTLEHTRLSCMRQLLNRSDVYVNHIDDGERRRLSDNDPLFYALMTHGRV